MPEMLLLLVVWVGVLGFIAVTPRERMQMTWLVLVGLVLASPLIALIWPMFR